MYLEGTLGAPLKMSVLKAMGDDGEQTVRLAAPGAHTGSLTGPTSSATMLEVKNAALLGRLASFAIYSVDNGDEYLAMQCDDFAGETLLLTPTLSGAMQACRLHAATLLASAIVPCDKAQA